MFDFSAYGSALRGEDRLYGGNKFYVDTIPPTAFFSNLRASMSQYEWKKLSEYTRKRAGGRCEICSSDRRPEAHERLSFDASTRVQKLERLMCLCKACHLGT